MSYTDIFTPVIEKIQLPSGSQYYVADREARDAISSIGQLVAGGIAFIIAWDEVSTPVAANIPAGIIVGESPNQVTGTLAASSASSGAFYLIKSSTSTSLDVYDEYVRIKTGSNPDTYAWEKIGDTQLDLTDIVTNVSLNKQTDVAIGENATFSVTQPTVTLTASNSAGAGKPSYIEDISLTKKYVTSSTSVTPGSNDLVMAITGYSNPSSSNFIDTITPANTYLTTSSITGISGSTSASAAIAGTSQTTASGQATNAISAIGLQDDAVAANNTNWIRAARYDATNNMLIISDASMATQTTTQYTFESVTVPIAASATSVVTGLSSTSTNNLGPVVASISTNSNSALTGLGTPSTDSVFGADTTFSATTTNAISNSGAAQVVTNASKTTKYMSASATGGNVAWNSKDSITVLTSSTNVSVTKGST